MHSKAIQKYLSERNRKSVQARWAKTTPEERKAVSDKMITALRKKRAERAKNKEGNDVIPTP